MKKLISITRCFFTVCVPYKPGKTLRKPRKNRHPKSHISSPLVFHRFCPHEGRKEFRGSGYSVVVLRVPVRFFGHLVVSLSFLSLLSYGSACLEDRNLLKLRSLDLRPQGSGRGPENGNFPNLKWLGEGAKGVLDAGCQSLLALVHKRVAPVQNRVWVVQKTLGRPLLPGSKTPFAPSPNHFWEISIFGPSPRTLGSQVWTP